MARWRRQRCARKGISVRRTRGHPPPALQARTTPPTAACPCLHAGLALLACMAIQLGRVNQTVQLLALLGTSVQVCHHVFQSARASSLLPLSDRVGPVGFVVAAGTIVPSIPCTASTSYCPAGTAAPQNVTRGYYASGLPCSNGSSTLCMREQVACPPGHYCVNGVKFGCGLGTLRTAPLGSNFTDCTPCPAGQYCGAQLMFGRSSFA